MVDHEASHDPATGSSRAELAAATPTGAVRPRCMALRAVWAAAPVTANSAQAWGGAATAPSRSGSRARARQSRKWQATQCPDCPCLRAGSWSTHWPGT
jgi:hypothetical protein